MITSQEELQALVHRARATDAVALDTEFIWERTYYPKLGLIQLALSDEQCFLIDPLSLTDLSPLGQLLGDQAVVKIFHDAPQDLTILHQATGVYPQNIFDTRLAAGFAGLSSTISLVNLIKDLLAIELPKTETRTNWLKRPLQPKQVEYALDDVRYLRAIRVLLLIRMVHPTIGKWLTEELKQYDAPEFYQPPVDTNRYLKIKGAGTLGRKALARLRELATWREQEARRRNRPRGHILHDKTLLCLAAKQVEDTTKMRLCDGVSDRIVEQYGERLLALIKKGRLGPERELPALLQKTKLNSEEREHLKKLQERIVLKSDTLGLDPNLIATTSELRDLVRLRYQPELSYPKKLASGWRKEFLEEFI